MRLRDKHFSVVTEGEEPKGIQESKCGVCGLNPRIQVLAMGLELINGLRFVDLTCLLLVKMHRSSVGPNGLSGGRYFLFFLQ